MSRGRARGPDPRDEHRERRDRIVAVAIGVLRERGYGAGSLDDIAAALGLRKASLYYYVRSKSDLLSLVFDRAITDALVDVERLGQIDGPRDRLAALIRHQVLLVVGDAALFGIYFDQRAGLADQDRADIARKEQTYVHHFELAVDAAMQSGALPRGDPRVVANSVIGMTTWAYKWFEPRRDRADAFADGCVDLVLR